MSVAPFSASNSFPLIVSLIRSFGIRYSVFFFLGFLVSVSEVASGATFFFLCFGRVLPWLPAKILPFRLRLSPLPILFLLLTTVDRLTACPTHCSRRYQSS